MQSFIDQAREQGIPVLAEGAIAQGVPNGGFYVTPTLFGQVPRGNRLEQEEVFGPVLAAFSFEDADIDALVPIACKAIVQNTGQTCSAGSRVLVQKNVYDDFIGAVAKEFAKLRAGTPEMDLDCGPVINAK